MGHVVISLGEVEKGRTMHLAMWLQNADVASTNHLIMIFIGLGAVAMVVMAIALIVVAVTAAKAIKSLQETTEEVKGKVLPLIDVATDIGKSSQALLNDVRPKVTLITDNLVKVSDTLAETSKSAQLAVQQIDTTIADANVRAQRQVARVDGMVTAALTTTAEIVDAIGNGIRVPAQKIAAMATQAKLIADGLLAKLRSMAAAAQSGRRKDPS
jgi:uncharacterized protein YoxC